MVALTKRRRELMPVHITYFVHGTTTDNEANIVSGWNDAELSDLGVKQALELRKRISGGKLAAAFCSDLKRSRHTATIMWGESETPIVEDARIRECDYGDLDGGPRAAVEALQQRSIATPMPHGESYRMVEDRVSEFLTDLKKDYNNKHVAVVGHRAPQLALDVLIKRMTWKEAFANDWRRTGEWQPGWAYESIVRG